jgi:hypothetical protein
MRTIPAGDSDPRQQPESEPSDGHTATATINIKVGARTPGPIVQQTSKRVLGRAARFAVVPSFVQALGPDSNRRSGRPFVDAAHPARRAAGPSSGPRAQLRACSCIRLAYVHRACNHLKCSRTVRTVPIRAGSRLFQWHAPASKSPGPPTRSHGSFLRARASSPARGSRQVSGTQAKS